jgi:AcrR family transcriptional regulator
MARPRSDIRPRIVKSAHARFLAEGVDGASLREIARDARTNVGMIVYYFPTKDDLFSAVVEEVYAGILDDLKKVLENDGPVRDRLRGAFVRLGSATNLELDVLQLIARESLSSSTRLRRIVARFMRGHVPLVIATISDGIRSGEFDAAIPMPLVLLATLGLGVLPQIARRASRSWPIFASMPDPGRLADISIGLLYRAVGAPGASPARVSAPKSREVSPRRSARPRSHAR